MAIAVVATVATAGALAGASGTAVFSTGSAVLAGTSTAAAVSTTSALLATAATAGAVGSAVSQLAAMAMGVQDKFSWSSVGKSAIGSGMGAWLGQVANAGAATHSAVQAGTTSTATAASSSGSLSSWYAGLGSTTRAVVQGGLSNALQNQLISGKFSWRQVVASSVAGGLSSYLNNYLSNPDAANGLKTDLGTLGRQVAASLTSGWASSAIVLHDSKLTNSKANLSNLFASSLGALVGNAFVEDQKAQEDSEAQRDAQSRRTLMRGLSKAADKIDWGYQPNVGDPAAGLGVSVAPIPEASVVVPPSGSAGTRYLSAIQAAGLPVTDGLESAYGTSQGSSEPDPAPVERPATARRSYPVRRAPSDDRGEGFDLLASLTDLAKNLPPATDPERKFVNAVQRARSSGLALNAPSTGPVDTRTGPNSFGSFASVGPKANEFQQNFGKFMLSTITGVRNAALEPVLLPVDIVRSAYGYLTDTPGLTMYSQTGLSAEQGASGWRIVGSMAITALSIGAPELGMLWSLNGMGQAAMAGDGEAFGANLLGFSGATVQARAGLSLFDFKGSASVSSTNQVGAVGDLYGLAGPRGGGVSNKFGNVVGTGGAFAKDAPYVIRYDPAFPGRPDPQYSIDSLTFEKPSGYNAQGYPRDAGEFWKNWAEQNPYSLSSSNKYLIDNYGKIKVSPRVDQTWIEAFPEHGDYMGDVLIHHHVDFGQYTIPVPGQTHVGSGGPWHF